MMLLDTIAEQEAYLLGKFSRSDYLGYTQNTNYNLSVQIIRNHSFELLEPSLKFYLGYSGIYPQLSYSFYDDSLSLVETKLDADLLIVWLDLTDFSVDGVKHIEKRLTDLSNSYKKNVICILDLPPELNIEIPEYFVRYNLNDAKNKVNNFYDLRLKNITGTKFSKDSIEFISHELALKYIPSLVLPNLKLIVVDLDNTLYKGVLGEDGINGVVLTEGHVKLQNELKLLKDSGVMLAIASKNNQDDVLKLFQNRVDFILKANDFIKIVASWNEKSDSILDIIKFANVGTDSVLFIDDNLGEINAVSSKIRNLSLIHAKDDAKITTELVEYYPRLKKYRIATHEDSIRTADIMANEIRQKQLNSLSTEDYLKSLKVKLDFEVNNSEYANRVHELANKTNQFIFSYQRYDREKIDELMSSDNSCVVTVKLSDKLSDSGIVGVGILKKLNASTALVEELYVSCRALGRGLDDFIVKGLIHVGMRKLSSSTFITSFKKGERNVPAEEYILSNFADSIVNPIHMHFDLESPNLTINVSK